MDLRKVKINLETQIVNLENKCKSYQKENININRMISQKDKRIQEQDLEVQTHKKEVTSLQKQLKDVTLKHSINDMKVEKLEEDIGEIFFIPLTCVVDYQQRLEKEKATNKTLIAQVDEIQQKLEEETKEKQKYHRELMSHQDREKYYSDTNIGLKDNLEGLSEQ